MKLINRGLKKIKDITRNIDITNCCLVEVMNNNNDIYINRESDKYGYLICTAFYIPENEIIELSVRRYGLNLDTVRIDLKLPEDMYRIKNNNYTSPNEGISNILKLSKSLDHIRDIKIEHHLEDIIDRNNYISYRLEDLDKSRESCGNIFEFRKSFNTPLVKYQILYKDIHHNFGDAEIIIDGEKYIRCDIIRPFLNYLKISFSFKKIYTEWLSMNDEISIQWIGDKIFRKI